MLTEKELKKHYAQKRRHIKKRLKEFSELNSHKNDGQKFIELCFCLCTSQSNAKKVSEIIHNENLDKLLNYDYKQLASLLRKNTRFHNNKAKYIIAARAFIPKMKNLSKDPYTAREFLVKNIKGLGYKESSHFLRNIGYRNICIIDRHIIDLMNQLKVFKYDMPPKNPKEYLRMESLVKDYAHKVRIDVDELDLLLWSIKTGFIFK